MNYFAFDNESLGAFLPFIHFGSEIVVLIGILLSLFLPKNKFLVPLFLCMATIFDIFLFYESFRDLNFAANWFDFHESICSFRILFLLLGSVFGLLWSSSRSDFPREATVLVLCAVLGGMILITANHFLIIYLATELIGIPSYVLSAMGPIYSDSSNSKSFGSEASVKYFIFGSISSCLMLYGLSIIYGYSGDLGLLGLTVSNFSVMLIVGLCFVLAGMCFKLALFPFHAWLPDVYQGSQTIVTSFFASIPKLAVFVALFKIFSLPFIDEILRQIISVIIILSTWASALGAIAQKDIKRLLGYSSISHMSYVVSVLLLEEKVGFESASLYLFVYSFANIGLFAFLLRSEKSQIKGFVGLAKINSLDALCVSVLLLSMASIPPFAGFYTKFLIISSLAYSYAWLVFVMLLSSVVSAFYYLNIIKLMYFDDLSANTMSLSRNSLLSAIMIISSLFAVIMIPLLKYDAILDMFNQ